MAAAATISYRTLLFSPISKWGGRRLENRLPCSNTSSKYYIQCISSIVLNLKKIYIKAQVEQIANMGFMYLMKIREL